MKHDKKDFNYKAGRILKVNKIEGKKPLDWAMEKIMEQDMEAKKYKPYLDKALRDVKLVDDKIDWYQRQIDEQEKIKQAKLNKISELFDLAMVSKHELPNGYTVKTDNRYKLEVQDVGAFLKWLKTNCEPQQVLEFFKDAIKVTKLKSFAEKQINEMRINGELSPEIDGLKIYDVTFRRLTTLTKEKKNAN